MKEVIKRIYKRTTEYSYPSQATTTANALDLLSSGIYTEEERFVFELLQNAVDSFEPNAISRILHTAGGPTLILTDMEVGDAAPEYAVYIATYIAYSIANECPNADLAVLTCLRKTTRALQKSIALRLGLGNKVLIETIARVQGLTTDVTILFIPNTSLNRSLESRLFNVATSRAKSHTIIIADKNILNYTQMSPNVRSFLEKLHIESSIYVPQKLGFLERS